MVGPLSAVFKLGIWVSKFSHFVTSLGAYKMNVKTNIRSRYLWSYPKTMVYIAVYPSIILARLLVHMGIPG